METRYIFIFVHGMKVILTGMLPPIGKLRPETVMRYCICVSHCRSTMMLSVSSKSSSDGHATTVMSCDADIFVVNVPGRWAYAFSFQLT